MKADDLFGKKRTVWSCFGRISGPLRNALPFLCCGLVIVAAIYRSDNQSQTRIPTMNLGTSSEPVFLQQKNPKSNRIRKIQLEHTLQNALRHRKELMAARRAVAQNHSDENRKSLIMWQNECRQDRNSYAIIAAETDESVFAQSHFPRQLPY